MADLFADKAGDWDKRERVKALSRDIGAAILRSIDFQEGMEVMDFGAGTGLITSQVAPLVERIVAVDTSEAMLEHLMAKPELAGKVKPVCRDITTEPIRERFDLIMSAMALHHVPDTRTLLLRFAEHLKPGARIALADLDKEDGTFHPADAEGVFHHGFERALLAELLEEVGFDGVHFTTAHTVKGDARDYPVFLVTAAKP
ncbi:MAG: class I SAM-dependent methyltransferase [Gammaproteobacteria bacterium]|nr:class I SAM-dependent methyltransferase [Gammaproteobacteria bacterium]